MSRGGQPLSLQRKTKAKTRRGQLKDTKKAPGGPKNSYSVVLGFNVDCEGRGLEFWTDMNENRGERNWAESLNKFGRS
jgi:hypothetical protein